LTAVRIALSRVIMQNIIGNEMEVPVITLDPQLEQLIHQAVQQAQKSGLAEEEEMILEPSIAEKLQGSISDAAQRQEISGQVAVLLVSPLIRAPLARFLRVTTPNLHVLSYQEIPDNKQITIIASIGQ
jgi:flagellar biosynthesis protein FlhA